MAAKTARKDDAEAHLEKLTAILRDSDIKSLKVLRLSLIHI